MYGIPNMKLSKDVVERRVNLLKQSGVEFTTNVDVGKDISVAQLQNDFDALVFTTDPTLFKTFINNHLFNILNSNGWIIQP
jgi:glutamate synthase (NADPH/NADH) small chain